MLCEWLHEAAPTISVGCESRFGGAQVALERYGRAVVKRMSEGSRRVNPVEPVSLQRKRGKKWGACGEWMDGGAEVVVEAGEREVKGARGAAGLGFGLEDIDVDAELGEGDGGGEAVGSGADYGGLAD